jgi:hypothetical protein
VSDLYTAVAVARSRRARQVLAWALALSGLLALLAATAILGVVGEAEHRSCEAPGIGEVAPGGGPLADGLYAQPLRLEPGRRYEVGATEYGGPADPGSGSYGAIPDPTQAYLPAHPDTFAELSLLWHNPAQAGTFSFDDADALDRLAYMSALRVWHDGHSALVFKRDIGYGQGPGQSIENGQPYRLDLWWVTARALGVSKSAVTISLLPPSGSAATLQALPEVAPPGGPAYGECPPGSGSETLPLVAGERTRILASGLAAAGVRAPAAVRQMVAAANRLYATSYLYGGGHGSSLNTLQSAYDCSSAVSYVLHWGGVLGAFALDSTELESYGAPGPGRYVTIYANAAHTFIYIAGLRLDTVGDGAYDSGPNSGKPGARWRVSASVPGWSTWTVRHPPGL